MDATTSIFHNIFDPQTHASGLQGSLPSNLIFLIDAPSGNIFGWTQGAAMGRSPCDLGKD